MKDYWVRLRLRLKASGRDGLVEWIENWNKWGVKES